MSFILKFYHPAWRFFLLKYQQFGLIDVFHTYFCILLLWDMKVTTEESNIKLSNIKKKAF